MAGGGEVYDRRREISVMLKVARREIGRRFIGADRR